MNLLIDNLSAQISEEQLSELFAEFGEVISVEIPVHRETGCALGYGLVKMKQRAAGEMAIRDLNKSSLHFRMIRVKEVAMLAEDGNGIRIFIGNLHTNASEATISGLFLEFGAVSSVQLSRQGMRQQSGGFGYVEMQKRENGLHAIRRLNNLNFMNQFIEVREIQHNA